MPTPLLFAFLATVLALALGAGLACCVELGGWPRTHPRRKHAANYGSPRSVIPPEGQDCSQEASQEGSDDDSSPAGALRHLHRQIASHSTVHLHRQTASHSTVRPLAFD